MRAPPFTLFDVVGDALTSLRATWTTHLLFGVVFVAVAITSCCGTMCALVPLVGVLGGADAPRDADPPFALIVAIYAVLAIVAVFLLSLHEGVTLAITHAQARGEPVTLRGAIDHTLRRAPSIVGCVILRVGVDLVVPGLALGAVAALFGVVMPGTENDVLDAAFAILGAAIYLGALAWLLAMRGFFGLAVSACVRGEMGARAAFERSLELLRGRRWHFVGFRLAWMVVGIATYCASVSPIFGIVIAAGGANADDDTKAMLGLAMIPLLFVVYGAQLALFTVDSILVGSYHARLERTVDVAEVAKIFE